MTILRSLSESGLKWVEENLNYESWQMIGIGAMGLAVDGRYMEEIVEAMIGKGLKYGQDFQVERGIREK